MRLTCPNCGAQYEVTLAAIPQDGRDVQCSSCGHTWFQLHPDVTLEAEEPPVEDALPRRPDPEVMKILREEAERERAARQAERIPLESQAELDMAAPSQPGSKDEDAEGDAAPIAERLSAVVAQLSDSERARKTAPRRALLPDIEEINTAIGRDAEYGDAATMDAAAEKRARDAASKRMGFGIAVGIFAILTLLYSQGPRIAEAIPAFAPAVDVYVGGINSGRIWLDGALRAAVTVLTPETGGVASEG